MKLFCVTLLAKLIHPCYLLNLLLCKLVNLTFAFQRLLICKVFLSN